MKSGFYLTHLHRNVLTAENAENAEGDEREMTNSDEDRILSN